jgi:hypothetical protein
LKLKSKIKIKISILEKKKLRKSDKLPKRFGNPCGKNGSHDQSKNKITQAVKQQKNFNYAHRKMCTEK